MAEPVAGSLEAVGAVVAAAPVQFAGGACLAGAARLAVRGPGRGEVRLVDLTVGRVERVLAPPERTAAGAVLRLGADGRGRWLAGDYGHGLVVVWDLWRHRSTPAVLSTPAKGRVPTAWSPDGAHLATGGAPDVVHVWEAGSWDEPVGVIRTFDPIARVASLAWAPGGDRLAAAAEDGTLVVWDDVCAGARPPDPRIVLDGLHERLAWVWTRDGRVAAAVADDRRSARPVVRLATVDVDGRHAAADRADLPRLASAPRSLAAVDDGVVALCDAPRGERADRLRRLARVADGMGTTWDVAVGEAFDGRIAVHPGGGVVVLDGAGEVRFCDLSTGTWLRSWVSLDAGGEAALWVEPDGTALTNRARWARAPRPLDEWTALPGIEAIGAG